MRLLCTAIVGLVCAQGRAHKKLDSRPFRRPEHSKGLVSVLEHQVDHYGGKHWKTSPRRLRTGTAAMKDTQLGSHDILMDSLQLGVLFGPSHHNRRNDLKRGVIKPVQKRFLSLRGSRLGWFSPEAFIRSVGRR